MAVRGVWLTNVASKVLRSRERIQRAMHLLAESGFNTVYPVVWNKGWTLYKSAEMQRQFGAEYGIDPLYGSRDPLQEMLEAASAVGLSVIPWFEYGFACSADLSGGHILSHKPQWGGLDQAGHLLVNRSGHPLVWMNAFDPEVQNFLISLICEVLQYPVAGFQGDDRLPATPFNGGYDAATITQFTAQYAQAPPRLSHRLGWIKRPDQPPSHPAWIQWRDFRAAKLTDFLARLRSTVKAINPDLLLSMAPNLSPWALDYYLQDVQSWMKGGLVDTLHPQIYRADFSSYARELDKLVQQYPSQLDRIFPGIVIKAGSTENDATQLQRAIDYNRKNGIQGEVYFFFEGLRQNNGEIASFLKAYYARDVHRSIDARE
ncbi:glycoside hydrolase family 10 protein [Rivularia sp. UHCC 0363]|uniref:glycoside hydrolase family 10 protein n=1 Tax=Rivularia sp. UHCC 0363 TaxID=3110244 RepID=UPI002B1EDB5F|nr:family 10 glycosylhydrolase [Rivularia sp. UHCC 0363]MEA5597424.1 family 10 glycosylhydrolase [Rivularia sp. UHCC 0363]